MARKAIKRGEITGPPDPPLAHHRIAKKGRHVATLPASDAEAAIQQAIRDYGITEPHRQRRLVAQPMEQGGYRRFLT